jgi:hypothetical protein
MPRKQTEQSASIYFPAAFFRRAAFKRTRPFEPFFKAAPSLEINSKRFMRFAKRAPRARNIEGVAGKPRAARRHKAAPSASRLSFLAEAFTVYSNGKA